MIRFLHLVMPTGISLAVGLLATFPGTGAWNPTNNPGVENVMNGYCFLQQKNHPPVIKIIQPATNSVHQRNALVRYAITVSDHEDGESRFDEIPSDKIFLQIESVDGTDRRSSDLAPAPDDRGFQHVRRSDCFNCHQFKAKSIGPSFASIARRYKGQASVETLADKIRNGSQGLWGKEIMPAHPDIAPHNAKLIAQWIISAGMRPADDYLPGKEGTFWISAPEASNYGYLILTARYDDLGLEGNTDVSITGSSSIVIEYK